jgi:hypothetical protein
MVTCRKRAVSELGSTFSIFRCPAAVGRIPSRIFARGRFARGRGGFAVGLRADLVRFRWNDWIDEVAVPKDPARNVDSRNEGQLRRGKPKRRRNSCRVDCVRRPVENERPDCRRDGRGAWIQPKGSADRARHSIRNRMLAARRLAGPLFKATQKTSLRARGSRLLPRRFSHSS